MSSSTPMTPTARLTRGLKYSTVGPVDLTRGAVGVGVQSARSSATFIANRHRRGRITQALQDAGKGRRRPRPILFVGAGVAVLAVGAVTFSIVRRSTQPEPSPRPPSVDVAPRP